MKKVIIISYAFPPVGGAGVQRPVKFVKYLRNFGWEPVVITAANPSVPLNDTTLLKDIPQNVKIYYARTLEPSYEKKLQVGNAGGKGKLNHLVRKIVSSILIPDIQVLWWPGLLVTLWKAIREEKPNCIFVTAPPFSCVAPVVLLGKILDVPVLPDFRDEWIFARKALEHANQSCWAIWVDAYLERFVINHCAGFTAATQSYIDAICQRHGNKDFAKGLAITNGYDEDDFKSLNTPIRKEEEKNKQIILYAGTVWKATSLAPFFEALGLVVKKDPSIRERVLVKIVGRIVEEEKSHTEDPILAGMVSIVGYMAHEGILSEMMKADILLLTLSNLPGAERIIPGKTFEYIASGKPILAIIPSGETSRVLSENYLLAEIISPDSAELVAKALVTILLNKKASDGSKFCPSWKFSRQNLTKKLANKLASIS